MVVVVSWGKEVGAWGGAGLCLCIAVEGGGVGGSRGSPARAQARQKEEHKKYMYMYEERKGGTVATHRALSPLSCHSVYQSIPGAA